MNNRAEELLGSAAQRVYMAKVDLRKAIREVPVKQYGGFTEDQVSDIRIVMDSLDKLNESLLKILP